MTCRDDMREAMIGIRSLAACALPTRAFAIGNPRVVDGDELPCD